MLEAFNHVMLEHIRHASRIWILAREVARKDVLRTSLGMGWIVFRDSVYFLTFTLVRFLLAGNRHADGVNFVAYLLVGFIIWSFLGDVLNVSPRSIRGNKAIINSISFPIMVLPTIDVLAIFFRRAFSIFLIFLVSWGYGYFSLVKPWLFVYYLFSMFMIMVAFNLTFSAINAISLDFSQLYESLTRIMIYTVPLLWSFDQVAGIDWAVTVLKANPLSYILLGVRSAVLGSMSNTWEYTLYFWFWVFGLLFLGSFMQFKLHKYYADYV